MASQKKLTEGRKLWLVGTTTGIIEFDDFNGDEVAIFTSKQQAEECMFSKADSDYHDGYIIEVNIEFIKKTQSQIVTQSWEI